MNLKTPPVPAPQGEPSCVSNSIEAALVAAVIRQAVEDYAVPLATTDYLPSRKYARHMERCRVEAGKFLFEELPDFLHEMGVEELFHVPTIQRKARERAGETIAVEEHAVAPGTVSSFPIRILASTLPVGKVGGEVILCNNPGSYS